MRNFLRWTSFTAAVALVGLMLAFGLLFVGRLYSGLQQSAFVLTVLMLFSVSVTIAAINFASKLEEEEEDGREIEAGGVPKHPTRDVAEGGAPDIGR